MHHSFVWFVILVYEFTFCCFSLFLYDSHLFSVVTIFPLSSFCFDLILLSARESFTYLELDFVCLFFSGTDWCFDFSYDPFSPPKTLDKDTLLYLFSELVKRPPLPPYHWGRQLPESLLSENSLGSSFIPSAGPSSHLRTHELVKPHPQPQPQMSRAFFQANTLSPRQLFACFKVLLHLFTRDFSSFALDSAVFKIFYLFYFGQDFHVFPVEGHSSSVCSSVSTRAVRDHILDFLALGRPPNGLPIIICIRIVLC